MADTKISALGASTGLVGTEEFVVNDAGTPKKVSGTIVRQFMTAATSFSTATQAPATTDTYITGSGILIPASGFVAGQVYRWYIGVSKTAAGVATPIWTFRIGSARTTADTSRLVVTGTAQVATASGTLIEIIAQVLVVSGTVGTIAGSINTGSAAFGLGGSAVSAGFANNALAGNYIGLSVTPGTSAAWTINSVAAELT